MDYKQLKEEIAIIDTAAKELCSDINEEMKK